VTGRWFRGIQVVYKALVRGEGRNQWLAEVHWKIVTFEVLCAGGENEF
jgi:hypothetical protein